jgi:hypothetical protein
MRPFSTSRRGKDDLAKPPARLKPNQSDFYPKRPFITGVLT